MTHRTHRLVAALAALTFVFGAGAAPAAAAEEYGFTGEVAPVTGVTFAAAQIQVAARTITAPGDDCEVHGPFCVGPAVATTTVDDSGAFALWGLTDGQHYAVFFSSPHGLIRSGFYDGAGQFITPVFDHGVRAQAPGLAHLEPKIEAAGSVAGGITWPTIYPWDPDGKWPTLHAVRETASGPQRVSSLTFRPVASGATVGFELFGLLPGVTYVLEYEDPSVATVDGYVAAGGAVVPDIADALRVTSGATGIVVRPSKIVLEAVDPPTVRGFARVGGTLHAGPGKWNAPGLEFGYQWYRSGVLLDGVNGPVYTPTRADQGQRLRVKVVASRDGFPPGIGWSVETAAVAPERLTVTRRAAITGTAKFGAKVTAVPPQLSAPGARVTYQWLRGGKVIKGATKKTYRLGKKDVGARVSVRATATLGDYPDVVSTSAATKKVVKAAPKVTAKLAKKTVKHSARAKLTITVRQAGIAKPTGRLTVRYGKKKITVKLAAKRKGKVSLRLPRLARGTYKVKVTYTPTGASKKYLKKKTAKTLTLKSR